MSLTVRTGIPEESGSIIKDGRRVDAYERDLTIKEALKMIQENNCPWKGGDCENKTQRAIWRVKPPVLFFGDKDNFGRLSLDVYPLDDFLAEEKKILDDWNTQKYAITSGSFREHMKRGKKALLRISKCKKLNKFYKTNLDNAKKDLRKIEQYFEVKGFDAISDGMRGGMIQKVPEIVKIEQVCLEGLDGKREEYYTVAWSGYQFLDDPDSNYPTGKWPDFKSLDKQIQADNSKLPSLRARKKEEDIARDDEKRQKANGGKKIDAESKSRKVQHYLTSLKFNGVILAPKAGTVTFAVKNGDYVEEGQLLLILGQGGGDNSSMYERFKGSVGKQARKAQQYLSSVKFDGKIFAPKAGTVESVVEVGTEVKKGQRLLFLRVEQEGGGKRIYKRKRTRRRNSKYIKKTKKYKKSKRNKRKNTKRKNTKIRR